MRAIDADALEELFREVIGGIAKKPEMNGNLEHMVRASAMVVEMIKDAPTIEPERKTGRWIWEIHGKAESGGSLGCATCSECGKKTWATAVQGELNFCPNCGVKMGWR